MRSHAAGTTRRELTVLGLARSVLGDLDVEVVLERVLDSARALTGARYAAIGVLDASRERLERFITSGIDPNTRAAIGPLPTGRGVLGELIRDARPLRLDDVGTHERSYGFPIGHPPMRTFLGVPLLVQDVPYGNVYLTEKESGEPFSEEDEEALVALAEVAGVAIDHARRFTGSEVRREELERTVTALDATIQISQALAGQTDLQVILELVAKRGRALVTARALVIEHLQGGELAVAACAGDVPAGLVGQKVGLRNSVANAAISTGLTQRLEDEPNRVRFERYGLGRLGFHARGGLVVPLVFRGVTYGALLAIDRLEGGPSFTAEDQRLLESFAGSAANAIATATSVAADRRSQRLAATEEERRRWARELHDETLQGLAALRLGLSATLRAGSPDALADAMRDAIEQLDGEIASLRSLITELRPAALDQLGVAAALEALAARTARQGLEVDLDVDLAYEGGRSAARPSPDLETAVYRIVQESLTNARKHGEATRAVVEVREGDRSLDVVVRDNGAGFDTTAPTGGFGLLGIAERVELLAGTLAVTSAPGEGTTVTAALPVEHRAQPLDVTRAAS